MHHKGVGTTLNRYKEQFWTLVHTGELDVMLNRLQGILENFRGEVSLLVNFQNGIAMSISIADLKMESELLGSLEKPL